MSKPLVSAQDVLKRLREADEAWAAAVRGVDRFPNRLRTFAEAANEESRALTLADLGNITWKPQPGASQLPLPFEFDARSGRPGSASGWKQFEQAMKQLAVAIEGEDIRAVAGAFARVSETAAELADALDQAVEERQAETA